ncbi:PMS1 protein homolog 1 isoform X2 [Hypomesus transpacificus]|uniref:PMS1 protein homolog 1 isoform X2 n=1 Tax=Hypomesus transpacificus TaxID=137520 RepID=UPI001F072780|nr:PMS1 protein homolog 1 isoform X2 [Hypomesus transpacificus]
MYFVRPITLLCVIKQKRTFTSIGVAVSFVDMILALRLSSSRSPFNSARGNYENLFTGAEMKRLPADTVRLLSSSQIITCVVNVVKELLENSLDAGASCIELKLENYGLDQIEVRDNGSGIKVADAHVMALKHYTSKMCSYDDLECLETYGFRGEALGSICAVAEVTVTTKTIEDDVSTQYVLDHKGKVTAQMPTHLGKGTTVSVLKLFKSLPVRRQYCANIKKCKEELKKVQDIMMAYAILKPALRLIFIHNKVVVWQKTKATDHRMALLATLGANTVANLVHCHHRLEQPEILIDGYFPKPGTDYCSNSSSNPDKAFIFVNNRPVQQKDILKLVRQHYMAQPYLADSTHCRYPILMLNIIVPAYSVDVNLKPDKTQVLLHNKEAVLTAVETLLVSLYRSGLNAEALPISRTDRRASSISVSPQHARCLLPASLAMSEGMENVRDVSKATSVCVTSAISKFSGADALLNHEPAISSSSSSSADDWIVNEIPVDLNVSLLEDDTVLRTDLTDTVLGGNLTWLSEESWSRGTALLDPCTEEALQSVKLYSPTGRGYLGVGKVKGQCRLEKKVSDAITDKQASLTAIDLINHHVLKTPLSPASLCEKEYRSEVLQEKPKASLKNIGTAVQERRKILGKEDRIRYEEKAKKHSKRYDHSTLSLLQGQKRKDPLSNQKVLTQVFYPQPQKRKNTGLKLSQPLPFSITALRLKLHRLSFKSGPRPRGHSLVNSLASQSSWVILYGSKLMLLNPYRAEESLIFKRLLENSILPTVTLRNPIQLTDSALGVAEYAQALYAMAMGSPELNGMTLFADPRLVANGFEIKLNPESLSAERQLEVTAMANCIPFYGMEDLREILATVLHSNAKTVGECRPLKVTNYFQGDPRPWRSR